MFSPSIPTISVIPPPSPLPSSPTVASASSTPEPIGLQQAIGQVDNLIIPCYTPDIAKALLLGDAPDAQDSPCTIGGMGTLQQRLIDYPGVDVVEGIASLVEYELDIKAHTRETYRAVLDSEEPRELNSLMPGLAAMGSKFNNSERYALYAGTLRLLGGTKEDLTTAPHEGSRQLRIYNAIFCLPAVTDDLNDQAIIYSLVDEYLDAVQNFGRYSIYELPPPGI